MAGSRSSCGTARHLGHMVALRHKLKQKLSVDYSKPPMISCNAQPLTIGRCQHVTAADFGSSRLDGVLAPVPPEPKSSRASGDSALPQRTTPPIRHRGVSRPPEESTQSRWATADSTLTGNPPYSNLPHSFVNAALGVRYPALLGLSTPPLIPGCTANILGRGLLRQQPIA